MQKLLNWMPSYRDGKLSCYEARYTNEQGEDVLVEWYPSDGTWKASNGLSGKASKEDTARALTLSPASSPKPKDTQPQQAPISEPTAPTFRERVRRWEIIMIIIGATLLAWWYWFLFYPIPALVFLGVVVMLGFLTRRVLQTYHGDISPRDVLAFKRARATKSNGNDIREISFHAKR